MAQGMERNGRIDKDSSGKRSLWGGLKSDWCTVGFIWSFGIWLWDTISFGICADLDKLKWWNLKNKRAEYDEKMLEVSFEIDVCKSSMHYANFKVSFGFCFEYFDVIQKEFRNKSYKLRRWLN